MFYSRGRDGLPREWIRRMKSSISKIGTDFSSHRMVMEYTKRYYIPAMENRGKLLKDDHRLPKGVAAFLARVEELWEEFFKENPESKKLWESYLPYKFKN